MRISPKPKHKPTRKSRAIVRRSRIISSLLRWYRKNCRDLPWRDEKNPYRILVSEVMLQQTQVSRVLAKYPQFLKDFPTFARLADAKTSKVIRAWRGMGYNNRALRLQNLSRVVVTRYSGRLPGNIADLMNLPGVGRYTAHAVACFAFGERVPVVDTNVARVLGRLYPRRKQSSSAEKTYYWALAEHHLPRTRAHDWNQALMDLGATICTAAKPKCDACPLRTSCPSAFKKSRQNSNRSRNEPGRGGVPNRIYRGRAVEVLRNLRPGGWMTSSQLARKIKSDFNGQDQRWFISLLRGLERDGLVRGRGRSRISLPD
jgi:A/G-specific adenine glycosylase